MNNKFKQNIINIYGKEAEDWLSGLPNYLEKIAVEWNLSSLKSVDNLSMNYVASGFQGSQAIILKLSLDSKLIEREYTALKALRGYGAVEVIAHKDKILLLKKLSPAISLKSYLPAKKNEALKIACDVSRRLHQAPLSLNINLPTIEERFELLDKNWPIPQDYLNIARKFRDCIFNNYHQRKILHGDLHHDNILQDGDDWKVIDPHGVIGFPINELWAFIQDIDQDIPYIAKYFDLPIDDIKKCYFMHSVLSSIWAIEDNMDPSFWLELVNKISSRI